MILHKKINFINLDIIQETLLKYLPVFPEHDVSTAHHLNLSEILMIPDLKDNLINFDLIDYLECAILGVVLPGKNGYPIHIDKYHISSTYYSINIPILNCANSLTRFYNCRIKPNVIQYADINNNESLGDLAIFDKTNCKPIDEFTLDNAVIMNIKVPHEVVNFNKDRRLALLLRLTNNFNFEDFCQKY
jgi:hypothetical protein